MSTRTGRTSPPTPDAATKALFDAAKQFLAIALLTSPHGTLVRMGDSEKFLDKSMWLCIHKARAHLSPDSTGDDLLDYIESMATQGRLEPIFRTAYRAVCV